MDAKVKRSSLKEILSLFEMMSCRYTLLISVLIALDVFGWQKPERKMIFTHYNFEKYSQKRHAKHITLIYHDIAWRLKTEVPKLIAIKSMDMYI